MSIQFKTLTADEAKSYHVWARENDTPTQRASADIYHPEVRAEWARIDAIVNHPTTVAIKEYRYDYDHSNTDIKSSYGDPSAPKIKLDNMDRDDGSVLVTCDDSDVKEEFHSIAGSNWEAPSDMIGAYAVICDSANLIAELEKEGYDVDSSEYSCPE